MPNSIPSLSIHAISPSKSGSCGAFVVADAGTSQIEDNRHARPQGRKKHPTKWKSPGERWYSITKFTSTTEYCMLTPATSNSSRWVPGFRRRKMGPVRWNTWTLGRSQARSMHTSSSGETPSRHSERTTHSERTNEGGGNVSPRHNQSKQGRLLPRQRAQAVQNKAQIRCLVALSPISCGPSSYRNRSIAAISWIVEDSALCAQRSHSLHRRPT